MRRIATWIMIALGVAGLSTVAACTPTPSPTPVCGDEFWVTKEEDTDDGDCSATDCSLREAVIRANACPGHQTIHLPAGGYILTLAGADEDAAATGDLDITDDLTILGEGVPSVSGNDADRAFEIFEPANVVIDLVMVTDGRAILGGGIMNRGTLILSRGAINDNLAEIPAGGMGDARGGGIFNVGTLTVNGTGFLANVAEYGGAIHVWDTGSLTMSGGNLSGNQALDHGGGIAIGPDASAVLSGIELRLNEAGLHGGGIWNDGSLTADGIKLDGNQAAGNGGGLYNWDGSEAFLTEAWFVGNTADLGGGLYNLGLLHLYRSSLTDNVVVGDFGGGAFNQGPDGSLLLRNTTLSHNSLAASVTTGGGGIYNSGSLRLEFVTLAYNTPDGVQNDGGPEVNLRSTLVAENTVQDCNGVAIDSLGYNLDGDGSCALAGMADLSGVDPMLGGLDFNGGVNPNHALLAGSPAIDSGDPDRCVATDQRNVARPQGAGCDRGAYEAQALISGSIGGMVWHDLCAVPYETVTEPPPGCIFVDGGGLEANGILETGEPGIELVEVQLGSGPCPATGMATATTDSGGLYAFAGLAAGTYCVSVNALDPPNDAILIPGGWTFPVRGAEPATAEVSLAAGENQGEVHFGWDYQFLAAPPVPTETPTATAVSKSLGTFSQDGFCRKGPSTLYDTVTAYTQGSQVEVVGRSEPGRPLWWFVRDLNAGFTCWASDGVLKVLKPVENFAIVAAPATPIPEPTETPIECRTDLSQDLCQQAGGTWVEQGQNMKPYCKCP